MLRVCHLGIQEVLQLICQLISMVVSGEELEAALEVALTVEAMALAVVEMNKVYKALKEVWGLLTEVAYQQ